MFQWCSRIFIITTSSCLCCHVTSRIYTSLCRRKSNLDQSQLEGVCWFLHIWQARTRLRMTSPRGSALQQQKRAKMLWKQDCSISESEPTKTSHLLQALVQRFNTVQLYPQGFLPTCMRDPLFFPFDSCSFPVAIYYSRIFPIFSSESFEFCWPLRSHIVFNWRAPSQSHEWGRFPHHLLLIISVQPEQNRATGYRCVLHSVSRLLRRIDAPQTFISSWFHIQKQHICVSRIGQTRASLKLLYKKWWPVGQCSKTGFSPIRIITINRRTWSLIPPIPAKDPWRPRRRPAAPNAQTQEVRANCCLHRQLTWQWISDSSQRQVLWCKSQWERWKQNRSWHIHSFLISTEHLSI